MRLNDHTLGHLIDNLIDYCSYTNTILPNCQMLMIRYDILHHG